MSNSLTDYKFSGKGHLFYLYFGQELKEIARYFWSQKTLSTWYKRVFFICISVLPAVSFSQAQNPHVNLEDSTDPRICLSCHDGVLTGHNMNHPYEANYLEAQRKRSGAVLKPIDALPSSMKLIDGMVVCTTCHDMQSTFPYMLHLSNEKSAMCFACHDR